MRARRPARVPPPLTARTHHRHLPPPRRFNPQFSDVTGGSVPPADEAAPLVPMPPRIDVHLGRYRSGAPAETRAARRAAPSSGRMVLGAAGGDFRIDYASVLPPTLHGLAARDSELYSSL